MSGLSAIPSKGSVKSVQRGVLELSSTVSGTINVSSVNVGKSQLTCSACYEEAPNGVYHAHGCSVTLSGATTIDWVNGVNYVGGGCNFYGLLAWELVEYY